MGGVCTFKQTNKQLMDHGSERQRAEGQGPTCSQREGGSPARASEGHSLSSLALTEGLSVPGGARAAALAWVGWGFVGDCPLLGSASSVAVPTVGRAPGESGKRVLLSALPGRAGPGSDLALAASARSSVK